jgi:hypothetical protein
MQKVDEIDKAVTFDMFLELSWKEPRLKLPAKMSRDELIPLPSELLDKLWTPDPFILNLKSMKSPELFKPPKGLEISGDSIITLTTLGTIELGCDMNFK